tara:strand:- start:938 stop:1198 length:261 start_codon:yes stop_codon:yes gene_type:complete
MLGGFVLGVLMLLVGAASAWGYYSTNENTVITSVIINLPVFAAIKFSEFTGGFVPDFISLPLAYLIHFVWWIFVYSNFRKWTKRFA